MKPEQIIPGRIYRMQHYDQILFRKVESIENGRVKYRKMPLENGPFDCHIKLFASLAIEEAKPEEVSYESV